MQAYGPSQIKSTCTNSDKSKTPSKTINEIKKQSGLYCRAYEKESFGTPTLCSHLHYISTSSSILHSTIKPLNIYIPPLPPPALQFAPSTQPEFSGHGHLTTNSHPLCHLEKEVSGKWLRNSEESRASWAGDRSRAIAVWWGREDRMSWRRAGDRVRGRLNGGFVVIAVARLSRLPWVVIAVSWFRVSSSLVRLCQFGRAMTGLNYAHSIPR